MSRTSPPASPLPAEATKGAVSLARSSLSRPLSVLRACLLIGQLRLTRSRNRLLGPRSEGNRQGRPTTDLGPLFSAGAAVATLGATTALGVLLGRGFAEVFGGPTAEAAGRVGLIVGALLVVLLLLSSSYLNRELSASTAEVERLLLLPTSITTLLILQLLDRALFNRLARALLYPLLLAFATRGVLTWGAFFAALGSSQLLLLLLASWQLLCESAARVWLSRRALDTLQLVATVLGISGLVALAPGARSIAELESFALPAVTAAVRFALAFEGASGAAALSQAARAAAETCAVLAGVGLLLRAIGNRAALSGPRQMRARSTPAKPATWYRRYPTGVVQHEALRLLRDRRALYTAACPPLLIALQLVLPSRSVSSLLESPAGLATVAYLVGGLTTLTAAGALQMDGKALWLQFTVPRPLAAQLALRGGFWAPYAATCCAIVLIYGAFSQPLTWELAVGAAYALIGVCLLTMFSLGLAGSSVDVEALGTDRRSKAGGPGVLWAVALMACFSSGFYGPLWTKATLVLMTSAVVWELWRDAARKLPLVLDPSTTVPFRPGVRTGLSSAVAVMTVQQVAEAALTAAGLSPWHARGCAFLASAAALATALAIIAFSAGERNRSALLTSMGLGKRQSRVHSSARSNVRDLAAAVGLAACVFAAQRLWPAVHRLAEEVSRKQPTVEDVQDWIVVIVLTCVGAPLLEELLFRGMIYRGLRHSLPRGRSAHLSATLFAAIHPPIAWLPTYLLGLIAAKALERTLSLVGPVTIHIGYNAALLVLFPALASLP